METDIDQAIAMIEGGGVGVLPTDTLYGLVGSAFSADAVDRIYDLKQRDPEKPLIVLISDILQLEQFGVIVSDALIAQLETYWPGPYSIILPTADEQFEYLHRGTNAIAFRLPDDEQLVAVITQAGPIVAPSANVEDMPPSGTIEEARSYFGTDVDFYVDGGELRGKPSTIIFFDGDEVVVERE
ncbi:MAG: threonylcarbamoyl-AMP synthase [Candidatus Lloydbacteria bacterium RIFCSPHIGHO2_01_FULL_49_22]|uniref:L-threonylcarbamoyladenylate synthase n=1 Tax=Candidatus Lloydbacteria bacterium RIFCSPHIGHO2_01_FULL_49_22 TaxID=1798658 RepID=A0A1G2CV43_9BACT|nr:MAG: threonylcarbamoyl-AMP synthase [Candidatus Lloydbacteria bacterium RIFCSPHIGHO2_01_FULL_49_22]OGZ10279.1 MAG: threonylcarbamoyl-AMP synthase [Candidatus Lloydbacteria bacterium RIFCSPHIGHO2_02_FULL_50_18]